MKKLFFLTAVLATLSFVVAEDRPKVEVYGGYSFLRDGGVNITAGFGAAATFNFTDYLGIVADFSYGRKKFDDVYQDLTGSELFFLFGPQVALRSSEQVTPFFRGLFGVGRVSAGATVNGVHVSVSESKFAYGFGGGLDVKLSKSVDLRVFQADYIRVSGANIFRFGAGIVFKAR